MGNLIKEIVVEVGCESVSQALAEKLAQYLDAIYAPTPPPPSETKLSEALNRFEVAAMLGLGKLIDRCDCETCSEYHASRSSLESLYRELLEERNQRHRCYLELLEEQKSAEAELSALRSLQLTGDPMILVVDTIKRMREAGYGEALLGRFYDEAKEAEKRLISSKATSEEL